METTDLRTEFTKETKTRFNTEWLAYNTLLCVVAV